MKIEVTCECERDLSVKYFEPSRCIHCGTPQEINFGKLSYPHKHDCVINP